MTSDPTPQGNTPDDGALDDAALEVSGGAAPQGSAAPAPFFKRDTAWAQAGVDHAASLMNSHSAGQPDGAIHGVHAGVSHGFSAPGGGSPSVTAGAAPIIHAYSNVSFGTPFNTHSTPPPADRKVGFGNAPSENAPFSSW